MDSTTESHSSTILKSGQESSVWGQVGDIKPKVSDVMIPRHFSLNNLQDLKINDSCRVRYRPI
jgi:hypothetical protein